MQTSIARVALIVTLCASAVAMAGPGDDDWQFSITPYLWLPSVDTQLGVRDVPNEVGSNTSAFDIFSKLDFALLLAGEVRKGRIGLFYDFQTLKLSDDGTIYTPNPRGFEYELTFADATVALGYRVIDESKFSLDAFGGARALYAETSIDIDATLTDLELKGEQDKTWFDPIVGVKCQYRINEKWALLAYGDIGGFDVSSDLTWQLLGAVSYSFNEHASLVAGYRAFADEFEKDDFKFDTTLYGPVIGVMFVF